MHTVRNAMTLCVRVQLSRECEHAVVRVRHRLEGTCTCRSTLYTWPFSSPRLEVTQRIPSDHDASPSQRRSKDLAGANVPLAPPGDNAPSWR